jgi:cytochrome oxidase Cu insertion factor (SCO1/SenC/PrrC family)
VLLTAALLAAAGPAACGSSASSGSATSSGALDGAALTPVAAPEFSLRDQSGQTVSLASLRGHVVALTFLGTRCGATCDVLAQQIRGALGELPVGAAKVVVISAEPKADTPDSATVFLARNYLNGRASFLLGTPAQLRPLYRDYRVHPPEAVGERRFDEYAFVMLIDRSGRERALFETAQLTPEALASDIRQLGG